ncbi:hypothetical protein AVEN_253-1 [Araneus ventricosus]|uniref:Uncharacterized protein n=1 Tax=Araneus ventricosus TaxID=182803 RepID=A0A4Y2E2I3_ARAVE|nr:hypothetical protein AVEN_253-1 [Araneus ventricosus]
MSKCLSASSAMVYRSISSPVKTLLMINTCVCEHVLKFCGGLSNLYIFHLSLCHEAAGGNSYMKDAKKVQLCARTIYPDIYSSAFFVSTSPDQDREKECQQRKATPHR